jgi:hypothetical protein
MSSGTAAQSPARNFAPVGDVCDAAPLTAARRQRRSAFGWRDIEAANTADPATLLILDIEEGPIGRFGRCGST